MKTKYYIRKKKDDAKIRSITEKIHEEHKDLINSNISWEEFTLSYFWFDLPKNDLERIRWVSMRPTWVFTLNKKFTEKKYPYRLSIVHGFGVTLLSNGDALSKAFCSRTEKRRSTDNNTVEIFDDMLESFPEATPMIDAFRRNVTENWYAFRGRLEESGLPADVKKELRNVMKRALPSPINDDK